jgi:CheY-specific phosphatase CheX
MENIREILKESIFEVFEKMFFIFLEPGGRAPVHDYEAAIRFDGPQRGAIRILFTRAVARLMVRNMLGLGNGDVTDPHVEDCVKEAANMVCGNFLVNLDASKKFTMSLPEFSARPGQPPDVSEKVYVFDFECEDGKMGVVLEIEAKGYCGCHLP